MAAKSSLSRTRGRAVV